MYQRLVNNVLYVVSIIFLIGSIYAYIFKNDNFNWFSLFGTDGLTFFGLIIALISMLAMKIPLVKRIFGWVLLRFNFSQIDNITEAVINFPPDKSIDNIKKSLFDSLATCTLFKNNKFDVNQSTNLTYSIFHRGMAANIIIKKIASPHHYDCEEEPNNNTWKLEINGGNVFHRMEKNIKFFTNNFLDFLTTEQMQLEKINLTITNENTEYNLNDKGILIDRKKYNIRYSNVEITSSPNTTISINSTSGLSITSTSKGDFINAMDALKNILIS